MQRLTRLQLIGPLVLFLTVGAADVTAYALAEVPTSASLWFLNQEVFAIFRKSRMVLELWDLPLAQLAVAALLLSIALAGMMLRRYLLLALSSNLSLLCAGIIVYSSHYWNNVSKIQAASLVAVQVPTGTDLYFFTLLLVGSLMSFVASHCWYFLLLRQRAQ